MAIWELDEGVLPSGVPRNILLKMDFEKDADLSSYKRKMVFGAGAVSSTEKFASGAKSLKIGNTGYLEPEALTDFKAIGTGDFSVEFDVYVVQSGSGYTNMFAITNAAQNVGCALRIGDAGFGHQLQLSGNMASADAIWNVEGWTRTQMLEKWTNIRIQRKAGMLMIWVNKVKTRLRHSSGSPTQISFASASDFNQATLMSFGAFKNQASSTFNAVYIDNVQLTNNAAINELTYDVSGSDITNGNLRTIVNKLGYAGQTGTVNVNLNVNMYSSDTTIPALEVGDWPAGVDLRVSCNKSIIGMYGAGGQGSGGTVSSVQQAGKPGGTALKASKAITNGAITFVMATAARLYGGGGGGGGGAFFSYQGTQYPGGAGGRGAGGTFATPASGSAAANSNAGAGGAGGAYGTAGTGGKTSSGSAAPGGLAGKAVEGTANIKFQNLVAANYVGAMA